VIFYNVLELTWNAVLCNVTLTTITCDNFKNDIRKFKKMILNANTSCHVGVMCSG
jgi:hypothetical protein